MKSPFKIGFWGGFILGIFVCLSMDLMLGGSLGGGWGEAVSNDLYRIMGVRYPTSHPVVIFGVAAVISLVGLIGGMMGGFFASVTARFFAAIQARASNTKDLVDIPQVAKNQDP